MREQAMFEAFCQVMDTLLGENGCPWDRAQTHESLRPYLLEESYEAVDAIDQGDPGALCEELGDLLMEVVFHTRIAEKAGVFTLNDVLSGISEKLIRRHSHIFGADRASTPGEVEDFWEANKKKEKNYKDTGEMLKAVPKAMPALIRAEKVWKRAKATASLDECCERAKALLSAFQAEEAVENAHFEKLGELLFQIVKISAFLELNAEFSLTKEVEAFINSY